MVEGDTNAVRYIIFFFLSLHSLLSTTTNSLLCTEAMHGLMIMMAWYVMKNMYVNNVIVMEDVGLVCKKG